MDVAIAVLVIMAPLTALMISDLWLDGLITRAIFSLVGCLLPFRPGGRHYRPHSDPEKYLSFRNQESDR